MNDILQVVFGILGVVLICGMAFVVVISQLIIEADREERRKHGDE